MDALINLETYFDARPDLNRLTDAQTYEAPLENMEEEHLSVFRDSIVFPYYVSPFAESFSKKVGIPIIGNTAEIGEAIIYAAGGTKDCRKFRF